MTTEAQRRAWREATRRYRAAHPERVRASARTSMARYREANPDKARDAASRYRMENLDLYANARARRKAQILGSPTGFSPEDWAAVLEEFDHRCAYCQAIGVPLEREHMTPLSRGGAHTAQNIVPACGPCNRRKSALTAFEFLGRGLPTLSLQ